MHDIDQELAAQADAEIVDDLVREERASDEEAELEQSGSGRFFAIAQAMRAALQRNEPALQRQDALLSSEEQAAIELLHDAVVARTGQVSFIDAERRELLLNQALAVLQPVLALGLVPEMGDSHELYGELVARVEQLRERLHSLADAQEEIIAETKKPEEEEDEGDEGEGDEGDEKEGEAEATGVAVVEKGGGSEGSAGGGESL